MAADETPLPVLDEGQTRTGWMWVFATEDALLFRYSSSRGKSVPVSILGGSVGTLTVDGYTALGRAVTYLTNPWGALVQFLEDGRLRLTNNAAERQLRHIALGRNNWLFTGSDEGASGSP